VSLITAEIIPCWSTVKFPQLQSYVAAITFGNVSFFAGGQDNLGSSSFIVDIYNLSSNSWSMASLTTSESNSSHNNWRFCFFLLED